jgi:hypothetical protein
VSEYIPVGHNPKPKIVIFVELSMGAPYGYSNEDTPPDSSGMNFIPKFM